jgi:predicted amino acid racemase
MFINVTQRRNPKLIEGAVELHRRGELPSNCYVIDLDTVIANARVLSKSAKEHGLEAFQMSKQYGRNPVIAKAVAANGLERVVAVDFEEARILHRHGLKIGHLGHLVQVPFAEIGHALEMEPMFITVFGFEQAERIAKVASFHGIEQKLLIRVQRHGDTFYAAQRGGVPVADLVDVAQKIESLHGVTVAGVTSFPCVLFNEEQKLFELTPNLRTISEAAANLRSKGISADVVNAPSACCSATFGMKAAMGATHVEPGSALTGQTPIHAQSDQPEIPAMIYLSEVTHKLDGVVYSLGGGFYPRSRASGAIIYARNSDRPIKARVELDPPEAIDYYGNLYVDDVSKVSVGDSVVYAFRSQVFVSRCFVAVLANVATKPEIVGIFDRAGYQMGSDLLPISSSTE